MYGLDRLVADLTAMGFTVTSTQAGDLPFAVIIGYQVEFGRFATRVIDLGLPAPPNYPIAVGSSIQVRATPQLLEYENVPNVRNIIASPLGSEWRYWSHNFGWAGDAERSTSRFMGQVRAIFEKA
jgi:hypothetical protein